MKSLYVATEFASVTLYLWWLLAQILKG